ncbi:hypothetical protein VSVS05_04362 (plasmid) [Vibrio scophthalmi]|uniref:Uncharacterized protein n=1 Tax=Vibrio scophthalmi TaxID=45658 RepID=A0A1C7FI76_9VIBR|nr:hypothetical protein VSVS05_04362 [Vibrio scophthalmi]
MPVILLAEQQIIPMALTFMIQKILFLIPLTAGITQRLPQQTEPKQSPFNLCISVGL